MELDRQHYRTNNNNPSTNSELFICFASHLSSSSSMKISKSILSPGRGRVDPPVSSLSTSLSRRLRSNGSMKGGQASPMFPTNGGGGGKKRGCAFENPEPSSPKVTCIGQVRVKTKKKKKKAKQTRSLSRRRSGGEVSFRKVEQQQAGHDLLLSNNSEENVHGRGGQRYPPSNSSTHFQQSAGDSCMPPPPPHRNQRWVHLPVTICEALRNVGAEFSCLFPCRSSCFSTTHQREREREEKEEKGFVNVARSRREDEEEIRNGESSCGAVFGRWFVALQDCEGRQGKQIELVVGGGEEDDERASTMSMRSSRRHVFEDIEIKVDDTIAVNDNKEDEEKARLSICIPPKNALLLMRCRSDPMKMATLTNRFWESPAPQHHYGEDEYDDDNEEVEDEEQEEEEEGEHPEVTNETTEEVEADIDLGSERRLSTECAEKGANLLDTGIQDNDEKDQNLEEMLGNNVLELEIADMEITKEQGSKEDDESENKFSAIAFLADQEVGGNKENKEMKEEEEISRTSHSSSSENSEKHILESDATEKETTESFTGLEWQKAEEENNEEKEIGTNDENSQPQHDTENQQEEDEEDEEEEAAIAAEDADGDIPEISNSQILTEENQETTMVIKPPKNAQESSVATSSSKVLPDCLLLMMCEPKLSMEVSKETWVCSTDFIRWLPERHAKKVNPTEEEPKKRSVAVNTDSNAGNLATENKPKKPKTRQQQQNLLQPPRSSCTLPAAAAASMATMIEQKLVNAVGYEPFVLTRCKSEPMRTAAAKLAPESCFWNNRKLEPHRPATFGVGAAGVGF